VSCLVSGLSVPGLSSLFSIEMLVPQNAITKAPPRPQKFEAVQFETHHEIAATSFFDWTQAEIQCGFVS
jgi:hypothetical protein